MDLRGDGRKAIRELGGVGDLVAVRAAVGQGPAVVTVDVEILCGGVGGEGGGCFGVFFFF